MTTPSEPPHRPDATSAAHPLDEIGTDVARLAAVYHAAWDASEQRPADAKFLDGIRWCIEQRIKLTQLQADAHAEQDTGVWDVELNMPRASAPN